MHVKSSNNLVVLFLIFKSQFYKIDLGYRCLREIQEREIQEREIEKLVQETVKYGKKKNNRIAVFFIGQDGVGKTSLKKSLLGEECGVNEPSTVGIEFDVIEVKDSNKHEPWQRAADPQYIASEGYKNLTLVKEVARKISEAKGKGKAKGKGSDNNQVQNERVHGTGSIAVTVESDYQEVDKSKSMDKDEGGDGTKVKIRNNKLNLSRETASFPSL